MTQRFKTLFVSSGGTSYIECVFLCDIFQTPVSVEGLTVDNAADSVLEAKYREKLFTQV